MVLKKGYNYVRPDEGVEETGGSIEENHHHHHHHDEFEQLEHDLLPELYETIEIATHFGPLTGTLVAVKENYLIIVDTTGSLVFVPFFNIEFVSIV